MQEENWIRLKQFYVQLEYSLSKGWIKGISNMGSWSSIALVTHLNWWIGDLEIIYWIYLNW